MFPYWALFGMFAAGAFLAPARRAQLAGVATPVLGFCMIIMALMIGLRFEVGADWDTYEFLFSYANYASIERLLAFGDPGYQLLNFAVRKSGGSVWQVNLVCALLFCWGLLRFALVQPLPWLAIVVAIPYLVVVVAMGYTRQAVAIGILLAGLASFHRHGSTVRFILYVVAAALFHKTAVMVAPLVIFASERNAFLNFIAGVAILILLYNVFLESSVDTFVRNYIDSRYTSQGAALRVALNFIPGAIFLLWRRRFGLGPQLNQLWTMFSIAAVLFPIALYLSPSTTVVDRLALYIIPLQIIVMSRLPVASRTMGLGSVAVVGYSAAILFVWLTYAVHAEHWLPYQVYPF